MYSVNNRIVLEQYKKKELRASVEGGFARMEHKVSLAPLKVLVDAKLNDGTVIPAGSTAYVREEFLHNNSSAGRNGGVTIPAFHNDDVSSEPFIVLDMTQVEMIEPIQTGEKISNT